MLCGFLMSMVVLVLLKAVREVPDDLGAVTKRVTTFSGRAIPEALASGGVVLLPMSLPDISAEEEFWYRPCTKFCSLLLLG